MKFLILGRTATGKDTLAKILHDKYNWTFVNSITTRPKRTENEDTHIFMTEDEANKIPEESRVASTIINGYQYFATKEQLEISDGYIIDPNGLYALLNNLPDEQFVLIYMKAKDKTQQRFHALARNGEDAKNELSTFNKRYESENYQFVEFEIALSTNKIYSNDNIVLVCEYLNTYDNISLNYFAEALNRLKTALK